MTKHSNTILFGLGIIIIIITIYSNRIINKLDNITYPKYNVYYEYNIINNDTIPIDTIYKDLY